MFEGLRKALGSTTEHMRHITYASPKFGLKTRQPALEAYPYSDWGHMPDIEMATLLEAYKSSPRFSAAVDMHVEESVGHGYYITSDKKDNADVKRALQYIADFEDTFNMPEFNNSIARNMFIAGNHFCTPLKIANKGKHISGLDEIPLSSIVGIYRRDGITLHYRQQTYNTAGRSIPADAVLHFSHNRLNASPWGRGLGQKYCAPGGKYNRPNGSVVNPPSPWEKDSITDHISIISQYVGIPRFMALMAGLKEDEQQSLAADLAKLEPLAALVVNDPDGKSKIETLGLQTQGKMEDQQKRIYDNSILALMAPVIAQWDSENVQSYASSKEISKSILPVIEGYKMRHARFVEQNVLRPMIDANMGAGTWVRLGLKINWGQPATKNLDSVYKVFLILKDKFMTDVANPKDVLNMLADVGHETTPPDPALVEKREERRNAVQDAMTGKKTQSEEQEKDPNDSEEKKVQGVAESTKMSMDAQKEILEAKKLRAESIFYEYLANEYAVDGNEPGKKKKRQK